MKLNANLISGRTINQGANLENKTSQEYFDAAAYCELCSKDIAALGISSGNVKVTTSHGIVVVPVKRNDGNPGGIAFIPMGPWANAVLDPETSGCGMPCFKGVPAVIEPTGDKALTLKELIAQYRRK